MISVRTVREHATSNDHAPSVAVARLRGAALAVTAAAAAVEQYVTGADVCADDDRDCLTTHHAELVEHRDLVRRATAELERIEGTTIVDVDASAHAGTMGWSLPYVRHSREAIDSAHDMVVRALNTVRAALERLGDDHSTTTPTSG